MKRDEVTTVDEKASGVFVAYLNLWGTTAKLLEEADGGDLFRSSDLLACQTRFLDVLRNEGLHTLGIEVEAIGDTAYVYSKNVNDLVRFTVAVFQNMTSPYADHRVLWPVRAAIAAGVHRLPQTTRLEMTDGSWQNTDREQNETETTPRLRLSPYGGDGPVEAAHLEKSAQKGWRLFLTKPVGDLLLTESQRHGGTVPLPLRDCFTRGKEHYELNWIMAIAKSGHADQVRLSERIQDHLLHATERLGQHRDNYCQQMAASLRDLLDWCEDLQPRER